MTVRGRRITREPQVTSLEWSFSATGAGPAIVLLHGLGSDAAAWDRLVPELASNHRVIAVDLPGYSLRTSVPDVPLAVDVADALDPLLAELGIESAVLVGHSLGGTVCLMTADRHPKRCAGLVLVAPGGFGTELNPLLPLLGTRVGARMLDRLYGPRAARTIERLAARVEARPTRDSRLRIVELMETYHRLRSEQARAQFRSSVRRTLALNAGPDRSRLAGLDSAIPILVLWGRDDRVLPVWHAKNATAVLPWATVHVLDGVGHTPHRSHPYEVARLVSDFAASTAVRRRAELSRPGS
jgi:pimeloyl-ACP methyl ester carboxylesterase